MSDLRSRPGRLIIVDGIPWTYRVGRSSVIAYSETGERRCDLLYGVKGLEPQAFERGQRKRTMDGMIAPGDVARWLSRAE